MNIALKLFTLLSLFFVIGCSNDDNSCTTDPSITLDENIIGTWIINEEDEDEEQKVTFNSDGTGFSSENSFYLSTENEGKEYHNFFWEVLEDMSLQIIFDYSPDVPVVPFIVSYELGLELNECDRIMLEGTFTSDLTLTR